MTPVKGKENLGTANAIGTLAKMFHEGTELIESKKSDNLFQQLETRNLTEAEETIIKERVELQRRMLAAYERQEKARKVEEICAIHPGLTQAEAEKALELCSNREEEAAARLAEPDFKQQVSSACNDTGPLPQPVVRRPRAPRMRRAQPGKAGGQVFVGTFRGRGYAAALASKVEHAAKDSHCVAPEDAAEPDDAEPQLSEGEDASAGDAEDIDLHHSEDVGIYGDDDDGRAMDGEIADEPQRYMLAKELSTGELRPATTSEANDIDFRIRAGQHTLPTPPSVSSCKPKDAEGNGAAVNSATVVGAARLLARQTHEKALKFLQKMPQAVAFQALELLKEQDPSREAALSAAFGGAKRVECPAQELVEAQREASLLAAESKRPRQSGKEIAKTAAEPASAGSGSLADARTGAGDCSDGDSGPPQKETGRKRQKKCTDAQQQVPSTIKPEKQCPGNTELVNKGMDEGDAVKEDDLPAKQAPAEGALPKLEKARAKAAVKAASNKYGRKQDEANCTKEKAASVKAAELDAQAAQPAEADSELEAKQAEEAKPGSKAKANSNLAISSRGHTNRGRVRQKSHKSAELVEVGSLRAQDGWFNAGYIFPEGFKSKVNFRSSVELDQLCVHECSVIGRSGQHWPAPTFVVVAMDRPEEPLVAKSCTGCWTAVLKRINAEIEARRKAGEDLPPPPKTAIAGPEYFGFNQAEIQDAVELLDSEHACADYWQGKADREARASGLPVAPATRPSKPRSASGPKPRRKRTRGDSSEEDIEEGDGDEDEAALMSNKWSAVSRQERYRKRCGAEGDAAYIDADNPLPGWIDPITLEPVASPAISPWGHVMGMATWKAILSSSGKCPFTQRKLSWEQCQLLTKRNILRHKDRIVADDEVMRKFGLR